MRENRAGKGNSGSDVPDSITDPAGYKTYMRHKLGQTKLG